MTSFSKVDINEILNTNSFSLSKVSNLFGRGGIDQNAFCVPCGPNDDYHEQTIPSNTPHDTKFTSLAFNFDKPFDIDLLKAFLDETLRISSAQIKKNTSHEYVEDNYNNDVSIYTMKGMIKIKGQENLYILQSVYDIFDIQPSDYVGKSSSSIILIGLHLNENELSLGFSSCLAHYM